MSIRVQCPSCDTEYALADHLAGKKVRCKKCMGVLHVGASAEADAPAAAAFRAEPPRREREQPVPTTPPDRPQRCRDQYDGADPGSIKKSGPALWLILGGAGAVLLLMLACGGVGLFFLIGAASDEPEPVAIVEEAPGAAMAAPAADNTPFHSADVRKSVVLIRCVVPGFGPCSGSGFLVSKDGLVATNRHLIQPDGALLPASQVTVGVPSAADPDRLDYFKAEVAFCAAERPRDFALLKIAARPGYPAFRPLALAAAKPVLGDPVAVLGYPGGMGDDPNRANLFFNKGGLLSTGVEINKTPYYPTDATVSRGSAGGPLINTDGAVLGIVTLAKKGANVTYALPLGEIGLAAALNDEKVTRVQPEPGPLDPKAVSLATIIPPRKAHWDVVQGQMMEEEHSLIATTIGAGSAFWVVSKEPLPENFQLSFSCLVPSVRGRDRFVANDRQLYVRFDTDETDHAIDDGGGPGTTVVFTPTMLSIWNRERSANKRMGIPFRPFLFSITRQGGDVIVAVDGEAALQIHLDFHPSGTHKVSIGSRISYPICFGEMTVVPLDAGAAPPVVRADPPRAVPPPPTTAPPAPPTLLSFDDGWDKPLDPDGDCKILADKQTLTIEVPAKRHDLMVAQAAMNAPRLLRDATGDFTAQVKVGADFKPAGPSTAPGGSPFVGAGLVVIAGDGSYLRLERAAVDRNGTTDPYINWEARAAGRQQPPGNARLGPDDKTITLRLRRQGNRFFASFSRDGVTWTDLPSRDARLPAAVKVGVAAVTSSAAEFKARFSDFRLGSDGRAPAAPPPPPVDMKIFAAQPPADWKGPQWTTDLDKMKLSDDSVGGWVMGAEFKPDEATFASFSGSLTLRQGKQAAPGAYFTIDLGFQKTLADLEGKTITVSGKPFGAGLIWAHLGRTPDGQKLPKMQTFPEYSMKLEFGKGEGLKLPGKIYICFPDEAKSVIAGKFLLESK